MGQPQPTWGRVGSGAGVGPWLLPHGPNPVCSISSLSLGASPEPASWDEADFAEREGHGWMDCWSPHTSHLPTLALGTWSLLSMVGTGPSWPSDSRPGSRELPLSTAPIHLNTCLFPFLNLGVPPQGSEWLEGLRRNSSSAPRVPPPWDTCKPGPPRSQGARRTFQEESQTAPPSPAPARARSGPTRAGAEAICACLAVGPSVQHRETVRSKGPSGQPGRAAAPKEQARAGAAATLSHLITYTYSF